MACPTVNPDLQRTVTNELFSNADVPITGALGNTSYSLDPLEEHSQLMGSCQIRQVLSCPLTSQSFSNLYTLLMNFWHLFGIEYAITFPKLHRANSTLCREQCSGSSQDLKSWVMRGVSQLMLSPPNYVFHLLGPHPQGSPSLTFSVKVYLFPYQHPDSGLGQLVKAVIQSSLQFSNSYHQILGSIFSTVRPPAIGVGGLFKDHWRRGFLLFTSCFKQMIHLPQSAFSLFMMQLLSPTVLRMTTSSVPLQCQGCFTETCACPCTHITVHSRWKRLLHSFSCQEISTVHLLLRMGISWPFWAENEILMQFIY